MWNVYKLKEVINMTLYARFENEFSKKMKKDILKNLAEQFRYLYKKELFQQLKLIANFKLPDPKDFRWFSEDLKQIKGRFHLTTEEWLDYNARWNAFNEEFPEFCEFFGLNKPLDNWQPKF